MHYLTFDGTTLSTVGITTTGNTILGNASSDTLNVGNGDLIKDSLGNLGLGVTPSAWGVSKAIQIGGRAAFYTYANTTTDVSNNSYIDGANLIYLNTATATYYRQNSGQHQFYNAPSGTAGNPITFTQAMTLDLSGSLLVGTTTDPTTGGVSRGIVSVKQLNDSGAFSGIQIEANANTTLLGIGYDGSKFTFNASYRTTGGFVPVAFNVGNSERMRITSDGIVSINNQSPTAVNSRPSTLFIGTNNSGSASELVLGHQGDGFSLFTSGGSGSGTLTFAQGTTGLMTLQVDGKLGIGTPTPDAVLQVYQNSGKVATFGNNVNNNGNYIVLAGSITNKNWVLANNMIVGGEFGIGRTSAAGGTTIGSTYDLTINSSGTVGIGVTPSAWGNGIVALEGYTGGGSSWSIASGGGVALAMLINNNCYYNGSNWIYKATDTASSYFQYAGTHNWRTAASGTAGNAITFSEVMRLDASGNLFVNCTTTPSASVGGVQMCNPAGTACKMSAGSATSFVSYLEFINGNGLIGSITGSGTLTSYNVTSDQRLKTNIVDAPSGNIDSIKVRSFDWIVDGSRQEYGMVAQELLEVAPYAVTKTENPDDMMQVDYSKLVPMMIKEIQDLKQRIATLENK